MQFIDAEGLKTLLTDVIRQNVTPEAQAWLFAQGGLKDLSAFYTAFALMPRKTGKFQINIDESQQKQINRSREGFTINNWTTDRLARVWLLMQAEGENNDAYFNTIEKLFSTGEMNELVALYSALPVLSHPQLWVRRCAEGIRSNIGTVLEAIMYDNPYPAENLDEPAWNQMVMKAIFTEKDLTRITGLYTRVNPELARILIDYARERWAAGRQVDPALWQLAVIFVDETAINQMKRGNWENYTAG
ncbi:hypothetical protein DJ568_16065 [Mucilaginibacter hurinus]|uniref:Uncharacterized protein n=1 Tax=Mucilaginibacter hurinus TaxID=2201324 RepID=A0A367GJW5_9SPHI|nr:EboA domain-containing protein [Mucilaginibacter hurinus]RCH53752.1 hypothetical protein DJ568_16065 [Mucilaginibacter hurinus]